ncbi:MAG: hypothetical protein NZ807_08975 [Dehalococcoidia bacterium]|nr:hypothetical protein [Dehalococcoidia bacterium]
MVELELRCLTSSGCGDIEGKKAKKFVSFNVVVVTKRWGGNVYNARAQFLDFGPAPMGIVLSLAGDNVAERVPPLFFRSYGWK